MTVTLYPVDAVSGSPQFTAQDVRRALTVFASWSTGSSVQRKSGVAPGTPTSSCSVTSSTGVGGAHAGVSDVLSADYGGFPYETDGGSGSLTAADASNPRIDRVDLVVTQGDGVTTVDSSAFVYTEGTPNATPLTPAAPADSMPMFSIYVDKVGGAAPAVNAVLFPTFGSTEQVTSGIVTPVAPGSITGIWFQRIDGVVYFSVNGTYPTALTAGNIANTQIASITDSRFFPAVASPGATVSLGQVAAIFVNPSGTIFVGATTGTVAAGDPWSIGGSYPALNPGT